MNSNAIPHWSVWVIPIVALGVALLDLPYGYYQLLRVLVFCLSCYLAYQSRLAQESAWTWVFAGLAITYNPIVKLHLGSEIWPFVNGATILLLAIHFMHCRKAAAGA